MRRPKRFRAPVAGLLVLALVASLTGLLGASGTTIRITSPQSGARVSDVVPIRASVATDVKIAYVILVVDEDRPFSSNSAPYGFDLDTRELTDGPHRLSVEVYDRYGLVGSSRAITIYTNNRSSSAVQVKKAAEATRLATKPAAKPPVRTAAETTTKASPRAVASAAAADTRALASPAASSRGPLPAPTHTAAKPATAAARPSIPESGTTIAVASGTLSGVPARPAPARTGVRGHTVVLNGRTVAFDVAPYIAKNRLHVGFRAVMESIGAEVSWTPATRTAKGVTSALTVEVPIGKQVARVNGIEVDASAPAVIRKGRTMVPVRLLASATGSAVHWNAATRTASLSTKTRTIAEHRPAE
jgi:hypothetical protein